MSPDKKIINGEEPENIQNIEKNKKESKKSSPAKKNIKSPAKSAAPKNKIAPVQQTEDLMQSEQADLVLSSEIDLELSKVVAKKAPKKLSKAKPKTVKSTTSAKKASAELTENLVSPESLESPEEVKPQAIDSDLPLEINIEANIKENKLELADPKITIEIVPSLEEKNEPKAKGTGLSRSARRRRAKRIKKLAQNESDFSETKSELLSIGIRTEEQLPALLDENLVRQPKSSKKIKTKKKVEPLYEEDEDDENSVKLSGKRKMFVSIQPEEQIEFIVTDDGVVSEYFVEMHHQVKLRGNIYKAVVSNIDNNLQAAFVNFGGEKNGFLQIDEVHKEYWLCNHNASKGHKYPPINKALKVGQELLVQIVKEPIGNKGAFLTTWISLPGRYIVLTPGQEQVGISRKVEDQDERQRLKNLLTGLEPGENLGVILRTACVGASKTNIQKDLQFLKRLWKDIQKRAKDEQTPALIYKEADLAYRTLRDYLTDEVCELWTDNEESAEALRETVSLIYPRKTKLINIHNDPRQSLCERFNLQRQLEEVFSREVALKSGGRIVFDQTEALMAVDVNSAKTNSKASFEAMVFKTNIEAAEAVARHLRLRDIGGQIVIDFIEMRDKKNCLEVEKAIKNAMKSDRARYDIGKISSFGLLELIRQRTGSSAISISSEPCPHCFGTGIRRNMEWQAQESLREIGRRLRSGQGAKFQYETTMELCLYLLNNKRDRLTELENLYQCQLELRPMGIGN